MPCDPCLCCDMIESYRVGCVAEYFAVDCLAFALLFFTSIPPLSIICRLADLRPQNAAKVERVSISVSHL